VSITGTEIDATANRNMTTGLPTLANKKLNSRENNHHKILYYFS
jgi:hypothetical protein